MAWRQLESPWPVAGSVLVREGTVFALAGRSSYLDGGVRFVKLDGRSGRPLLSRAIYLRDSKTGGENDGLLAGQWMFGLMSDIPSLAGDHIFMNQGCITLDGTFVPKILPHLYRLGFSSPYNFSREFRKMSGISPTEYRRVCGCLWFVGRRGEKGRASSGQGFRFR